MENSFVSYLNSMNNAGSDTAAALAESQVLNEYYSRIKIERKLGRYISDRIRSGEKNVFILTGHAGDGKTSILVQVLSDLGMLAPKEKIEVEKDYDKDGIKLYSVKDMSELSSDEQLRFLSKAFKHINCSPITYVLIPQKAYHLNIISKRKHINRSCSHQSISNSAQKF